MTFDFDPSDLMSRGLFEEPQPQIFVLDWLFLGIAPAIALPVVEPVVIEGAGEVRTVSVQVNLAGLTERAEGFQRSRQFHTVVRRLCSISSDDTFVRPKLEDRCPAAWTRVATARAVGINRDVFQRGVIFCA